ncbi:MAG TPA: hypothetical protein VMA34_20560 [Terracidiphilus sp.]|nr:hypothetical protein [Terracidiphilus sp.]
MNLLLEAISALGALLLSLAAGLLLEELTLGVLVRLTLATRPETSKPGSPARGPSPRQGEPQ